MKLLCTLCALALLLALFPLPMEYYTFLRIFVTIGAITVLTQEIKRDVTFLGICFIVILFVFNPIVPIYLYKKALWMPLDFGAALLFLMYGYKTELKNHLKP